MTCSHIVGKTAAKNPADIREFHTARGVGTG